MAQLRLILQTLPETERSKIKAIIKSGRLISFVVFLDNVVQFFESIGRIGIWINTFLRPVLTGAAIVVFMYLILTGKLSIGDFK